MEKQREDKRPIIENLKVMKAVSVSISVFSGASVRLGHKSLRTLMKRSSSWYLPGSIGKKNKCWTEGLGIKEIFFGLILFLLLLCFHFYFGFLWKVWEITIGKITDERIWIIEISLQERVTREWDLQWKTIHGTAIFFEILQVIIGHQLLLPVSISFKGMVAWDLTCLSNNSSCNNFFSSKE